MTEERKRVKLPSPPFPAGEMIGPMQPVPEKKTEAATNPVPQPPVPEHVAAKPSAPPAPIAHTSIPEHAPLSVPESPEAVPESTPAVASPPLFVKVDKYHNIVKNIQKLKSYSLGLRDAVDVLAEIEKELQNGLGVVNRTLDNFNQVIGLLDAKLLRLQGVENPDVKAPEEMEEYIKNVYNQIDKIKQGIKSMP